MARRSTKKRTASRIERDTLGEVRVPREALWGAQTQRAVENFPVSGQRADPALIRAYLVLKKAAAVTNHALEALDRRRALAISNAVDDLLGDSSKPFASIEKLVSARPGSRRARRAEDDLRAVPYLVPPHYVSGEHEGQFVVDVFQAGAGTSFNMNCNEVIANLANRSLGGKLGVYDPIHPNDHVNMAQSTNDTFPTATRIAILLRLRELFPALDQLAFGFEAKAGEFESVIKSGRTHLQDAVPVTLGQEFAAWSAAVRRATDHLEQAADSLRQLGIGGTATGTGLNTPAGYRWTIVDVLAELTGLHLESMPDLREAMQSQLAISTVSSALRNLALELIRIANDLRLLSSGPLTGFAELRLPAVQPGSSIMPGKVNPSMAECLNQIAFHVVGADAAVAYAVQAGQMELNVMMPVMAYELLFSIRILANYLPVFVQKGVVGIEADGERCEAYYTMSPALATVLNPVIGYSRAAALAKESQRTRTPIPDLIRSRGLLPEREIARIFSPEFLAGQADRKPVRSGRRPSGSGKKKGRS